MTIQLFRNNLRLGYMKISFFLLTVSISLSVNGQINWLKSFGGNGTQRDYGTKTVVDSKSNVILAGYITDNSLIDNDSSTFVTNNSGSNDVYLAKFDSLGNYVLGFSIKSNTNENLRALSIDKDDNFYISGLFGSSMDFDPSSRQNIINSVDGENFIAKYTSAGTLDWVYQTDFEVFNHFVGNDLSNYFIGIFSGTKDFDLDSNINYLLTSNGYKDVFVAKYDSNMSLKWAKKFGSTNYDYGYSVVVDNDKNVYSLLSSKGRIDMDPSSQIRNMSPTGINGFYINKLDSSGNYVFSRRIGGTGHNEGYEVKINNNYLYVNGKFAGNVNLSYLGLNNYNTYNQADCFLIKMSLNGAPVWTKITKSSSVNRNWGIDFLPNGDIVTGGFFRDTLFFDSTSSPFRLIENQGAHQFVTHSYLAVRDTNGNLKHTFQLGDISSHSIFSLATSLLGDVYTTGSYDNSFNYSINNINYSKQCRGRGDGFIFSYKPNGVLTSDIKLIDNEEENVKLYPNPSIRSLTVEDVDFKSYSLSIRNVSGKRLLYYDNLNTPEFSFTHELKEGIYFVELFDKIYGARKVEAFIVQ